MLEIRLLEKIKQRAEKGDTEDTPPPIGLWTTKRDGEVKLRMDESGIGCEPPLTVHKLFLNAVEQYGDYFALASKKHGRGFAVGVYTTNSPEACQYVAENCGANIIVVENDKQLQKILEIESKLPLLKAIIQYGQKIKEKRPNLYSWNEFMALGSRISDDLLDKIIESQSPSQCCTLIYTSGTTGQPKGVMLSHDNHASLDLLLLFQGTLVDTLKEVRPTAFLGVPRVWEKMQERMKSVGAKSSALKRRIATWAKAVGLETNLKRMGGATDLPLNYRLARTLVYKKVRKALGLDRCTKCYTGAAPISRDTLEYFLSLDIPIYELYGMSESSGPHTVSHPDSFRLTRYRWDGRHAFPGDRDIRKTGPSWWRLLGCGKEITGCKTMLFKPDKEGIGELIITAGGENIPPVPIEDAVKEAVPILSNVMLVGDKAKFLGMLMTLKVGSHATRVSEIVRTKDPAVYTAIQKGVMSVNERATSNAQKIQKWVLLDKDFSIAGGELGPTMKLKRPVVAQMYKQQIDQIYAET
ncbi:hypothetical protein JD844_034332 [Phrynosoma platyrhinos]|uniref:Long-chain-fatty-acid--CoA ligase ACSBG2 n=1 Tax=Phrynosoma platyrhinos TaxID=52577 RepID=A0ABQ7T9P8_PHRPL|nr:hypothetical protein JD844_034332 [Phrynosoma platyrhinos]